MFLGGVGAFDDGHVGLRSRIINIFLLLLLLLLSLSLSLLDAEELPQARSFLEHDSLSFSLSLSLFSLSLSLPELSACLNVGERLFLNIGD